MNIVSDLLTELVQWHRERGFQYPKTRNPGYTGSAKPRPVAYPDILIHETNQPTLTMNVLDNDLLRTGGSNAVVALPVEGPGAGWPASLALARNGDLSWTPLHGAAATEVSALYRVTDSRGGSHVSIIICKHSIQSIRRSAEAESGTRDEFPPTWTQTPRLITTPDYLPSTHTPETSLNSGSLQHGSDVPPRKMTEQPKRQRTDHHLNTPRGLATQPVVIVVIVLVIFLLLLVFARIYSPVEGHMEQGQILKLGLLAAILVMMGVYAGDLVAATSSEDRLTMNIQVKAAMLSKWQGSSSLIVDGRQASLTDTATRWQQFTTAANDQHTVGALATSRTIPVIPTVASSRFKLQPSSCVGPAVAQPGRPACRASDCYVFIKTHKTGSSTLTNLLHRRGQSHKLLTGIPKDLVDLGWPGSFFPGVVTGFGSQLDHVNTLVNHVRFDDGESACCA